MAAGEETGGGGNVLTRKVGPLPTWGWLAIISVAGLLYYLHNKSTAASTASPSTTASTAAAAGVPQNVQVYQNYGGGQPTGKTTFKKHAKTPPTTPPPTPPPTAPPPAPASSIPQSADVNAPNYVPPVGGIYVPAGQVNVPNILWGPVSDAIAVIKSRGLVPVVPAYSGNPVVTAQSPTGGVNASPGSTVTLTVA